MLRCCDARPATTLAVDPELPAGRDIVEPDEQIAHRDVDRTGDVAGTELTVEPDVEHSGVVLPAERSEVVDRV